MSMVLLDVVATAARDSVAGVQSEYYRHRAFVGAQVQLNLEHKRIPKGSARADELLFVPTSNNKNDEIKIKIKMEMEDDNNNNNKNNNHNHNDAPPPPPPNANANADASESGSANVTTAQKNESDLIKVLVAASWRTRTLSRGSERFEHFMPATTSADAVIDWLSKLCTQARREPVLIRGITSAFYGSGKPAFVFRTWADADKYIDAESGKFDPLPSPDF
jgi:hypothetical protein